MKTIRHTARMSQPLHIEAPGCIINVRVGYETDEGQPITVVDIICDDYATDTWRLDNGEKFVSLRIVKAAPLYCLTCLRQTPHVQDGDKRKCTACGDSRH